MKRREFIKYGMTGLAAIAVGGLGIPPIFPRQADAANLLIDLSMEAATVEMVDTTLVFHWVFSSLQTGPSFPGPVIFATQGDVITLRVTNNLPQVHGFRIVGTNIQIPAINPGQTRRRAVCSPPSRNLPVCRPPERPGQPGAGPAWGLYRFAQVSSRHPG